MVPGLGPVNTRNLVSFCGSVEEIFRQNGRKLQTIPGIGPRTARQVVNQKVFGEAEKELNFIRKHGIEALFYTEARYPQRLNHCSDSPVLVYYKGNTDLNRQRMVAVIGTRSATEYGKNFTSHFIETIRPYDVTIVSGLAYGIDICAHLCAMHENIPTVGVVAHGLDRIYPPHHAQFAKKMLENGGLLTEYPSNTIPDRENFPSRNRIVAGICDAIVVVEAATKGGALITADIANSYNRDVFALPGRYDDPFSAGCNAFIRDNRAGLITSAEDLINAMGWEQNKNKLLVDVPKQSQMFIPMEPEEEKLVEWLKKGRQDMDALSFKSGMPMSKVNSLLLQLELKGAIKSLPGKVFEMR